MLVTDLGEGRLHVEGAGHHARLVEGAVQHPGVRYENAHRSRFETGGKSHRYADIACRLLKGAHRGFHGDRVTGVHNVAGDEPRRLQLHADPTRDGLDLEIDGTHVSVARAVG